MNEKEFTCYKCGKTFENAWSDEDALQQARTQWGDRVDKEEMVDFCTNCREAFMRWYNKKRQMLQ